MTIFLIDIKVRTQFLVGWPIFLFAKWQTEPVLCVLTDTLLVETDTIGNADDGVTIHAILVAQVRAIEHIGYTIAVKHQIAVIVSAHHALYIVLSQHIGYLIPVIHIAIAQWIVREDEDRRIAYGGYAIQIMFEPCYILWRYVSISHTNHRPRIETNKVHPIMRESKAAITEHTAEVHHTRL